MSLLIIDSWRESNRSLWECQACCGCMGHILGYFLFTTHYPAVCWDLDRNLDLNVNTNVLGVSINIGNKLTCNPEQTSWSARVHVSEHQLSAPFPFFQTSWLEEIGWCNEECSCSKRRASEEKHLLPCVHLEANLCCFILTQLRARWLRIHTFLVTRLYLSKMSFIGRNRQTE